MKKEEKDLNYYKNNCEEDYLHTPISVLRYITELEKEVESKINFINSSLQLKEKYKTDLEAYEEVLQGLKEDEDFRLDDNSEWSKQIGFMEGKISILANL